MRNESGAVGGTLRMRTTFWLTLAVLFLGLNVAFAAEAPEDACGCACEREAVFEFTKAPAFKKMGQDRYEITFASKGRCDVAVAIVDGEGIVVRHFACGVLGPNAPAPLAKDSLQQTLIWDGKNDLGRYVESPEKCRVKVGLGLKPEFEKVLMWDPRRLSMWTPGVTCDKDGVYVVDYNTGGGPYEGMDCSVYPDTTQIQVYDHQGNYVRTIFPFPRDKIKPEAYARAPLQGQPPSTAGAPQMKNGPPYSFVLPSGRTIISPDPASPCTQGSYFPHDLWDNAFVVEKGMLTLSYGEWQTPGLRFLRLGTDGSMPPGGYYNGESVLDGVTGPRWLSVSPDGQWMYASGLGVRTGGQGRELPYWSYAVVKQKDQAEHAVYRMRYDKPEPVKEPFLGVKGELGDDNRHFKFPEGVACDKEGRIYVADSGNNRVQVFDAGGKFVKSLRVDRPFGVAVHRNSGAIYVTSMNWQLGQLILRKFKSFSETSASIQKTWETGEPNRDKVNMGHLWLGSYSRQSDAWNGIVGPWKVLGLRLPWLCVDQWAAEPTVWTKNADAELLLLTDKGDRFVERNLQEQWRNEWTARGWDAISADCDFGAIAADPRRPYIYVGEANCAGNFGWGWEGHRSEWSPRINVESGEVRWTPSLSAIAQDGLIYNSLGQKIWRVDPTSYDPDKVKGSGRDASRDFRVVKPVAFDYGEGASGELNYRFCSGFSSALGISPKGAVYLHDVYPPMPGFTIDPGLTNIRQGKCSGANNYATWMAPDSANVTEEAKSLKGYQPRPMFPGGLYKGSSAILRFNEKGQLEDNNLIPGLPRDVSALQVDLQGNVYVGLCFAKAGADGKPLTGRAVAKFKPEGGRILLNGTAVPVPLTEAPRRPPDFFTLGYSAGGIKDTGPDGKPGEMADKAWAEGLLWSVGGYTWKPDMQAQFALDGFGRLFMPEFHRNSVAIIDSDGNFVMRVGQYGNADDQGPEIRMADVRFVAVSDKRLFINDAVNKRILSVRLEYQKEAEAEMMPRGQNTSQISDYPRGAARGLN